MGDSNSLTPFNFLSCKTKYIVYLLIFIMGTSVGTFCTLYIDSFSFNIQNFVLSASSFTISSATYDAPSPAPSSLSMSNISTTENVTITEPTSLLHNMSDNELLFFASKVHKIPGFSNYKLQVRPKVAFMFLTPGPLPLSPLWEMFFKGHEGLYSIYVHPHPSYNDTYPPDSVFYRRTIPSQPVWWGTISMIDAERRLLGNALLDLSNQRFVLLSDACIPLFNFTTIYNYLQGSNLSFIESYDDPRGVGRGRYNKQMWPNITIQDWRKSAQWFEIHRDLALNIVSDNKYYGLFQEFCAPPCYSDEHYLPTLVNILYANMNSNRTVTHVDWSRGGPHPSKYRGNQITDEFLNQIRFGSECVYNDNVTTICHLFARKFHPDTLEPLLLIAPLLYGIEL